MSLGADPEEIVYRQKVGLRAREPNPDAPRSIERVADGANKLYEAAGLQARARIERWERRGL